MIRVLPRVGQGLQQAVARIRQLHGFTRGIGDAREVTIGIRRAEGRARAERKRKRVSSYEQLLSLFALPPLIHATHVQASRNPSHGHQCLFPQPHHVIDRSRILDSQFARHARKSIALRQTSQS